MVNLYVKYITEKRINPRTGEAWKIDDVPELWREQVREAIENNSEEVPETPVEDEEVVEEETTEK